MALYEIMTIDRNFNPPERWATLSEYREGEAIHSMIIRAGSAQRAREIAAEHAGRELAIAWMDETTNVCELHSDGEECLLMAD